MIAVDPPGNCTVGRQLKTERYAAISVVLSPGLRLTQIGGWAFPVKLT